MADISDNIDDWSSTAASNSPSGSTSIGTGLDDNLRAIQAAVKAWKSEVDPYSHRNYLINGDFRVAQRGTSFTSATTPVNSDDTYLLDRWTLLSDGNDIVDVTQESTTVPTGGLNAITLDVETANKKFGIIQFVENKNCKGLIGQTCTLSFKAKYTTGATVQTLRAVILAWSSTADSVTSDVVSAWGVSGTNPTLVANWTAENTAADLTLTTSYQTFSVSGAIDTASTTNVAAFIYYNNADGTVGDKIHITDIQLEVGSVATEFEQRSISNELSLCQRYFEKSYNQGVNPAAASALGAVTTRNFDGSTQTIETSVQFKTTKRVAPTITVYNPSTGATGSARGSDTNDYTAGAFSGVSDTGDSAFALQVQSILTGVIIAAHWTAVAEL